MTKAFYFFSYFALLIISATQVYSQKGISFVNDQPAPSNDQIVPYKVPFKACGIFEPTISRLLTKPGIPNLEPGTISANQSISYNTIPELLTATPPKGGVPPYAYQWQNSIDSLIFSNIPGATSLNYQPGALTATTWFRQVQYSSAGGDTVNTNVIAITVIPMFVADLISANQRIYPNPTKGAIVLEIIGKISSDKMMMEVYGINGQKVLYKELISSNKYELSLERLPAGVYFIRIISGTSDETVKIIKQ